MYKAGDSKTYGITKGSIVLNPSICEHGRISFTYNGDRYYTMYKWALVKNTEANKYTLKTIDRLDDDLNTIRANRARAFDELELFVGDTFNEFH